MNIDLTDLLNLIQNQKGCALPDSYSEDADVISKSELISKILATYEPETIIS